MNQKLAFSSLYDVEFVISCWNKKIHDKGYIEVDALECLFFMELPFDHSAVWTNTLSMDDFERDPQGRNYYVLTLREPTNNKYKVTIPRMNY